MAQFRVPVLEQFEFQQAIINRTTSTPPGSPVKGDRYIVAATGTGAWAAKENKIAWYDGAAWQFDTPAAGWQLWDTGAAQSITFNGSAWIVTLSNIYEVLTNKSTDTALGTSNTLYPTQNAVKQYVDTAVTGLLDDRGNYDASVNTFPASGGSGSAGAVLKGDIWFISVAGTLGGAAVKVGDSLRALSDAPGQTAANWSVLETNIGFVPENVANKSTDGTLAANSDTLYASQKATKTYVDSKVNKDTYLDQGGANEISAANAKTAYERRGTYDTDLKAILFTL